MGEEESDDVHFFIWSLPRWVPLVGPIWLPFVSLMFPMEHGLLACQPLPLLNLQPPIRSLHQQFQILFRCKAPKFHRRSNSSPR
ncbi:unnamed protein product [Urochloa humidicola]